MIGLRLLPDKRPPALPDHHQALVFQLPHGPPGRVPGYPELLHQVSDARHPAPGRELAGMDAIPQDRGHLEIRRIGRIMIHSHGTRLDMPDLLG
jgi:hypothetical protein